MESCLYLSHHGIKGQKWGIRRYQNPDGTLTAEGRAKLGLSKNRTWKLDPDTNLGIKNRYQNMSDARRQLRARRKNYDTETKEILSQNSSIPKSIGVLLAREALKPSYSITGFQTNKAERFVESTALTIGLPTVYTYKKMNDALLNVGRAETGYKWVASLTSPLSYELKQVNKITGKALTLRSGAQLSRV